MPTSQTVTIQVNDHPVQARPDETLLSALRRNGIRVPTLCHLPDLVPSGACRLCVVEVEGQRNLVPSCAFPVREGMEVRTHSPRSVAARRTIVELLLANHPNDCLYCPRNGQCQLQDLAAELGVREHRYQSAKRREEKLDASSPAIVRDPSKCVLCGRCVRVCDEIQGVGAIDFVGRGCRTRVAPALEQGLNVSSCVHCGQCVVVCPTGALYEKSHLKAVTEALSDPSRFVVVQHAPSISVTLAEVLGPKTDVDAAGLLNAALRRIGFHRVFDTSFTADLTIMEEASELASRITDPANGPLPMFTSCSPGWVKFVEQTWPDLIPHLSSCKSPQQMFGALLKGWWAQREDIDPKRIFSVAIMPCTAKKFEAGRAEMTHEGLADVDAVLTTRELVQLLRMHGIDLYNSGLQEEATDAPFGRHSGGGKLFGSTGGVMEAALRTASFLLTGQDADFKPTGIRGLQGHKELRVRIGDRELGVAVVSGLKNARALMREIHEGKRPDLHFVEVMTCPGGCISGGGQPLILDPSAVEGRVKRRQQALYGLDRNARLRSPHENPDIRRLYDEFLGAPLGERSHALLHTHYARRQVL